MASRVTILLALVLVGCRTRSVLGQSGGGRLTVLPIVFSSPETRMAFGVLPQYITRPGSGRRPSKLRADLYYTLNRQYNLQASPEYWLAANRAVIRAKVQFRKWPTTFYGIGRRSSEIADRFTERSLKITVDGQTRISTGHYLGIAYSGRWGSITPDDPGGLLVVQDPTGSGKGLSSGLAVVGSRDTRNHVYLPTGGQLYRSDVFSTIPGSDYSFRRLTVDLREYIGLGADQSVAAQFIATMTSGDPPFRELPCIGEVLRGYGCTRFIAAHRWAARVEYRAIPVFWRLGFVLFAGVGQSLDRPGDAASSLLRYTVGFGVRYVIFRNELITIRQDFGFGRGSSGNYLDLNEAF